MSGVRDRIGTRARVSRATCYSCGRVVMVVIVMVVVVVMVRVVVDRIIFRIVRR